MLNFLFCKDKNEFFDLAHNKTIYCLGGGKVFFEAYEELGLAQKRVIVLDNDLEKQRMGIKVGKDVVEVNPVDEIYNIDYSKSIVLITIMVKGFYSIKEQIDKMNSKIVEGYFYYSFRKGSSLYERSVERQKEINKRKDFLSENEALKKALKDVDDNKFILPKLNVIVTEKCSLRCKDCRALIPHVEKPKDEPLEKVKDEISKILDAVDEVIDIEPIGGEPFLYPNISELLEWLCSIDKIKNVCITTNGTIIPSKDCLEVLRNKKIFIYISDYGYIEKMAKIVETFEKEGIAFDTEVDQQWFDVGGFECRNRSIDELRLEYINCYCEFVLKYVWDNKIWLCPRAPRLSTLKVFESEHDYIDLSKYNDANNLRDAIKNSFFDEYAEACNYCNQGDYNLGIIPAGIQIKDKENHSRYTLIDRNRYERLMKLNDKLRQKEGL